MATSIRVLPFDRFATAVLAIGEAAASCPLCVNGSVGPLPVEACGNCPPCRARRKLGDAKELVLGARIQLEVSHG